MLQKRGFIPERPTPNYKSGAVPQHAPGIRSRTKAVHPLTNYYFRLSIIECGMGEDINEFPESYWLRREYRLASDERLKLKLLIRQVKIAVKAGVNFTT